MDSGQDFNSDCLIHWKHLLQDWATVSGDDSSRLFVLSLLQVYSRESHQVLIEHLRALLLSQVEAVLPLASLLKHVKAREISTLDNLVDLALLHESELLLSVYLIN